MDVLTPHFDYSEFVARLVSASFRVLISDYDGTLAPFREQRDQAVPYQGVRERLEKISGQKNTRLVIVSGRPVQDVITLLSLKKNPEIWGSHGGECIHPERGLIMAELTEDSRTVLEEVDRWVKRDHLSKFCECKPVGAAFHWRGLSEDRIIALRNIIKDNWHQQMNHGDLKLQEFDGGLEIRSSRITKKNALERILNEIESDSVVAYLGDDVTDEDAFAALLNRGLKVLVRKEHRATQADIRLTPPVELLEFLDLWIDN